MSISLFRDGTSTNFRSVNRNMKGIAVGRKHPDGLALCHCLCAQSDVVVESFGPGVADRLGAGWDALRATNLRLVYARISGCGTQGSMREGKGYDRIARAFTRPAPAGA